MLITLYIVVHIHTIIKYTIIIFIKKVSNLKNTIIVLCNFISHIEPLMHMNTHTFNTSVF